MWEIKQGGYWNSLLLRDISGNEISHCKAEKCDKQCDADFYLQEFFIIIIKYMILVKLKVKKRICKKS